MEVPSPPPSPSSSSTFEAAIAIETQNTALLSPSPRCCNEQARSLNFKLSPSFGTPDGVLAAGRKTNDGNLYDSEKLKSEILLKADRFFNAGCIKIEKIENEFDDDTQRKIFTKNCEQLPPTGVSINIDGEFEVLLEYIDGLSTPEDIDKFGLKLCSNFDESSKAIVVSTLETLAKILNMPQFDPHAPPIKFKIKHALSLREISFREDNIIAIDIAVESVDKYLESKEFNPFSQCLNMFVKHEKHEFSSFCSCADCLAYREIVVHLMMEQFKASHMVVLLLEALLKAYSPLLKNASAFSHFEKLLDTNKEIQWLASGLIYNKKYEEFDFIYDGSLTDPTILVLFSSILMINSPMQLLQTLAKHISYVLESFAFGIAEIPIEDKLAYILDGFDHLCGISNQIASYFIIFERNFLDKFSLTWVWLCQRLFHQQVYIRFFGAITNSGEVLKEDDPLKQRYTKLVKRMLQMNLLWATIVWPELQKYNLSEAEAERRLNASAVHRLFDSLISDALRLPINVGDDVDDDEYDDDDDIYDDDGEKGENHFEEMHALKNGGRRVLWKSILSFAKTQWPNGFFCEPNSTICDVRCQKCGSLSTAHEKKCKCITCSIGGSALLPKKLCRECNNDAHGSSKSVTEQHDSEMIPANNHDQEEERNCIEKFQREISKIIPDGFCEIKPPDIYHISWAVFKHFSQRQLYMRDKIEEKYFCKNCKFPACLLARRLLNNEMAPAMTKILMAHFNPLPMLQSNLHGIFPVVFYFNPRMFASHHENSLHNTVVKAYWTFIISVFGTFFVDVERACPLNLDALEIFESDVRVKADNIKGNSDDSIFLEFLDTIRSSSSAPDGNYETAHSDEQTCDWRKRLCEFLKPQKHSFEDSSVLRISIDSIQLPSTAMYNGDYNAMTEKPISNSPLSVGLGTGVGVAGAEGCDANDHKRSCTPKSKKCCLEHAADFGAEHCKENHANRKRLKKDCSHARVNETRDRLRKKLQDVRKSQQKLQHQTQVTQQQHHQQQQHRMLQYFDGRLEMSTNFGVTGTGTEQTPVTTKSVRKLPPKTLPTTDITTATANSTPITPGTPNTAQSNENAEYVDGDAEDDDDDNEQAIGDDDMMDNKKQKMKKWLDETLTYIEGYATTTSSNATTNGSHNLRARLNAKKSQPQTKDPKKAAKKLKQKLRKEEEKRITELYEVREQFQDIYFKEFLEKIELKTLKNSGAGGGCSSGASTNSSTKRRCDKKKIADIEANIKKLQRAKAKLETNILELIATVKQTNTEFKFPYLPTKEQQQAKLQALAVDGSKSALTTAVTTASEKSVEMLEAQPARSMVAAPLPAAPLPLKMSSAPKFEPNIMFPYEMSFPIGAATMPPLPPPSSYGPLSHHHHQHNLHNQYPGLLGAACYTPPEHQTLSQKVMAALSVNEKRCDNGNNSNNSSSMSTTQSNDPSKRIVTIRRVHNPNMPDSQVTVTARGNGAHGQEKLLYTFVNGTMVPTTPAAHQQPQQQQQQATISDPNARKLSKSQLKKERRRLAKHLSLAQDLAISDCEDEDDDELLPSVQQQPVEPQRNLPKHTKGEKIRINKTKKEKKLLKNASTDSKSSTNSTQLEAVPDIINENLKKQKNKNQQQKVQTPGRGLKSLKRNANKLKNDHASSADDTDASSDECAGRSRITPTQPPNLKTDRAIKQKKTKQHYQKQLEQPPATVEAQARHEIHSSSSSGKSKSNNVTTTTTTTTISTRKTAQQQQQRRQQRRLKLINHGQFDNNPYKNLHMQDSDSELYVTASEDENDTEGDGHEKSDVDEPMPSSPLSTKKEKSTVARQNYEITTNANSIASTTAKPSKPSKTEPSNLTKATQTSITTTTILTQTSETGKPTTNAVKTKIRHQEQQQHIEENSKFGKKQAKQQQQEEQKQQRMLTTTSKPTTGSKTLQGNDDQHRVDLKNSSIINNNKNSKKNTLQNQKSMTEQQQQRQTNNNNNTFNKTNSNSPHQQRNEVKPTTRLKTTTATSAATCTTASTTTSTMTTTTTTSSKRAQRNRKKQQPMQHKPQQQQQQAHFNNHHHQHHHQHQNRANYTDCGAGIPLRMEYFNPNEVNIPSSKQNQQQCTTKAYHPQQAQAPQQYQQQQQIHYDHLTRQFHNMQLNASTASSNMLPPNVSIMDQLNRGVQVENLSLPPGITLTKVDPIKSEQLRLKSESIKRLAQPLQQQQQQQVSTYPLHHHQHDGSTIIAPPTAPTGNIIMVEGISPKPTMPSSSAIAAAAAAATAAGKASSKRKRRRNKAKQQTQQQSNENSCPRGTTIGTTANEINSNLNDQQQTKMITLRNPMFHVGPTAAAAASILQQPNLLPVHAGYGRGNNGGLSMASTMTDQPAAIIKNENGMFTIRNPALHQAVTNGLALGAYRQFGGGSINYYTPQEAVAEAAKSEQKQQQQIAAPAAVQQQQEMPQAESFSYFSNNNITKQLPIRELGASSQTAAKKISITCVSVDDEGAGGGGGGNGGADIGQLRSANPLPSPIARPSSAQRCCISAIGSEVKQNRHSANVEHTWTEYQRHHQHKQPSPPTSIENPSNASSSFLGSIASDGAVPCHQQSEYFNGYEVFPQQRIGKCVSPPTAAAPSSLIPQQLKHTQSLSSTPPMVVPRSPNRLFEAAVSDSCHMSSTTSSLASSLQHHRCGDDSPPPTSLLGYSSKYLDDIPNTGVIRYDDASFLKNLIPGQHLNKEVSIHNINESNFGRTTSPMSYLIEITPVFNVAENENSNSISKTNNSPSPTQQQQQQQQQHYLKGATTSTTTLSAGAHSVSSMSNYQQHFQDYDKSTFTGSPGSNDNNTANSSGSAEQSSYQPFTGYDAFDVSATEQNKNINLFSSNFAPPTTSQRSSPYLDDSFVQNLNALQISGSSEQCAQQQLNGEALLANAQAQNCNATTSSSTTSASGWW